MLHNYQGFEDLGLEPIRVPGFPGYAPTLWDTRNSSVARGEENTVYLDCTRVLAQTPGGGALDASDIREFCADSQRIAPFDGPLEIDATGDCSDQSSTTTACLLSHILAIRAAYMRGDELAIFAEDDISFRPLFDYLNASGNTQPSTLRSSPESNIPFIPEVSEISSSAETFPETRRGSDWARSLLNEARSLMQDPKRGKCGLMDGRLEEVAQFLWKGRKFLRNTMAGGDCETLERYAELRGALLADRDSVAVGVQLLTIHDEFYEWYHEFVDANIVREKEESCEEWGQRLSEEVCIPALVSPLCISHPKKDKVWSAGAYMLNRAAISFWYSFFFSDPESESGPDFNFKVHLQRPLKKNHPMDRCKSLEERPKAGAHTTLRLPHSPMNAFRSPTDPCAADCLLWGLPQGPRLGGMTISLVPFALEDSELSTYSERLERRREGPEVDPHQHASRLVSLHKKYIQDLSECSFFSKGWQCRSDFEGSPSAADLAVDAVFPPGDFLSERMADSSGNDGEHLVKFLRVQGERTSRKTETEAIAVA
uniref:Uncharacterized protein n=1 Tax=Chromera velia CCMP2878 TaxID=1169474 RepID=A0A0G4HX17_9ALVE|eukprot:Cvel_32918.t1-p1 / transcript=Cvel_32918.t1 / gene=Cvel_32918 / organism=Chromera_velia_CCMP2878 / gene_product=hypothetical protein / transcript_product=hypothetical protein / location=Cvel_scaffold5220:2361-4195(+) / protein_length=539 / sequence_SO=supercontig / SO=protein_coding / is_pseudo=false